MPEPLQYYEFPKCKIPEVVYVEQPLYCCGLGNLVGMVVDFTLTVIFIATLPITFPIVCLGGYIERRMAARAKTTTNS